MLRGHVSLPLVCALNYLVLAPFFCAMPSPAQSSGRSEPRTSWTAAFPVLGKKNHSLLCAFLRLSGQHQPLHRLRDLPVHYPQVFGTSSEEHMEAIMRVKKAKVRLCPPKQVPAECKQYWCRREGCQGGREVGTVTCMLRLLSPVKSPRTLLLTGSHVCPESLCCACQESSG